jgi:hypothetical protein
LNRKERRIYEREQAKKIKQKIDWKKVSKSFIELLKIGFAFAIIIFCITYYVVTNQNNIRKSVAEKPQTNSAKVTDISGRGVRSATYEYIVNGKKYENSTFQSYEGNIGDEICIEYSSINLNDSIYCNEKEAETVKDDVFIFSIKIFGIIILFSITLIFIQLLIGNKKLMGELTSRK